jgi:cyclopropane-fatty-acyl-phospholipid synthase
VYHSVVVKKSVAARCVFACIKHKVHGAPVAVSIQFPDGSMLQSHEGEPKVTIAVKRWWSFVRTALLGEFGFAQEYVRGHIDIEGDLRYLLYITSTQPSGERLRKRIFRDRHPDTFLAWLLNRLHMFVHLAFCYPQSQYNAEYHYGLHPEFYFNYLGKTGAYSTGIWYEKTKNVDEAQQNKWNLIYKKLRLEPGMRVCSVGSGFGFGEMQMAEKYGVTVDCYNICRPQNAWLRQEIVRRGLQDRVNVFDENYTDVGLIHNVYDRFLAIECVEHAGDMFRRKVIREWVKCLKEDGIGVIQWLSFDIRSDVALFIRSYLYPAVTMPPLGETLDDVVLAGAEIQDVLCARRHYHYTLSAWTDNFIKNWPKIHALDPAFYTESFRRKWLMYLSAGVDYLVTPNATARLYQVTFTKGDTDTYPMNREFLYTRAGSTLSWVKRHPWMLRPSLDTKADAILHAEHINTYL